IYHRTLHQNYIVHVTHNSSEVINGMISKTNQVISGVLNPNLILISSVILLTSITITLFTINILVAFTAFVGFGILYLIVIQYTRQQLIRNSKCIATQSTVMIKSLQEGLGGIRDILIDGSQRFYCQLYRSANLPLRRATGNNMFIAGSPRYVMEALGMSLIASLTYFMTQLNNDLTSSMPVLAALALGAQRLLPTLQQAYSAYSSIKGSRASLDDVLRLLDQPLPGYDVNRPTVLIPYEKEIELKNISFRYSKDTTWVLKNINLKLAKGSRIGFMGVTGSGKSTLLDIIMGLFLPTVGTLNIDEHPINHENRRSWQAHIAHVPQNIFLSDSTIAENIAFGLPKNKINQQRVIKAAKQAQISELIEGWQDGYHTFVGERGIRLSGGQRQRIGIARALYKEANLLIFDEATSALDNETEKAVMEAIEGMGRQLTILIIAHRLTTLKVCDQIFKLDNNEILNYGSYQEVINATN
ncbi:MAG: ABC transporter ATP-binding protein, partial [Flavobacteriales bacterium]|nr:ABC transporter ATP-binding protein [Flavobacteriales bacterium]